MSERQANNELHQQLLVDSQTSRIAVFSQAKIGPLTARVVIPALLVSLLFGIFVFSNQILMQKLIPIDGHQYFATVRDELGTSDWNRALQLIYGNSNNVPDQRINADWILATVSASGTIDLMIVALGLFVCTGSAVLYSRALANHDLTKQREIVRTGFYGSLLSAIVLTIIVLGVQHLIVPTVLPDPFTTAQQGTTNTDDITLLIRFYSLRNATLAQLTNDYLYFLSASIPVITLVNFYTFFLRCENRNLWITIIAIACNASNILFGYLLIAFARIGMLGAGTATLLGYVINLTSLMLYVRWLENKNQTGLGFKQLKVVRVTGESMFVATALGAGTFLRDLSLAIANIVYLPVWYATMTQISPDPNFVYQAQSVAPVPIYNLFFFAVFGIIDGMRPLIAHCLTTKDYARAKQIFWAGVYITLIYAVLVNLIVLPPTYVRTDSNQFLQFFGAMNPNGSLNNLRADILQVLVPSLMLQFFFLALAVPGLGLFQAAGKTLMNAFLSILQGVVTFFPVLYAVSAIAVATNSWQTMVFAGFINIVVSSIVIFSLALVYLTRYMGKKEKFSDPQMAVEAAVKYLNQLFAKKNVK